MTISNDTFFYVALFVVPGFVYQTVHGKVVRGGVGGEKALILSAIASSAILHALLFPILYYPAYLARVQEHPLWLGALIATSTLLAPALLGYVAGRARHWTWWKWIADRLKLRAPEPRAWDDFFGRWTSCIVTVTLDNGDTLAGYFGPNSVASEYPAPGDLYLERRCYVDPKTGTLGPWLPLSKGFWVDLSRVRFLQFLELPQTPNESSQLPIEVKNVEKVSNA